MTLGVYLALFSQHTRQPDVRDEVAVELLNQGWRHAAEDVMGLRATYNDTLVKGQSEYVLPAEVLKVNRVRLLDGALLKSEMTPIAPEDIPGRDSSGEIPQDVPSACCVTLAKHQVGSANDGPRLSLKFDCPPNWGAVVATDYNNDIEFLCVRTCAFVQNKTKEPDLPHMLGQAGLWWACYLSTLERRFMELYVEERNIYLRSGAGNQVRVMGKPNYDR